MGCDTLEPPLRLLLSSARSWAERSCTPTVSQMLLGEAPVEAGGGIGALEKQTLPLAESNQKAADQGAWEA